jgi:acyl carrier protein
MIVPREVRKHIALFLDLPEAALQDERSLSDVVAESFLVVQLVIELQEALGVRITAEDLRGVTTVGDLVDVFVAAPQGGVSAR